MFHHSIRAATVMLAAATFLAACARPTGENEQKAGSGTTAAQNHTEAPDILVHYPDGSTTRGLPAHLERLKPQFAFAPDTRIREHPIKLADGNLTAVQGIMEGTFSKPMDLGHGKVLQPTGKRFRLAMVTIGRWENGLMEEEWLYWDNAAFMQQIGAGQ